MMLVARIKISCREVTGEIAGTNPRPLSGNTLEQSFSGVNPEAPQWG
jgi:hypothetical protein